MPRLDIRIIPYLRYDRLAMNLNAFQIANFFMIRDIKTNALASRQILIEIILIHMQIRNRFRIMCTVGTVV